MGRLPGGEQRRMTARTAGVLLSKSIDLSNDVYLAMQSRGFRGEVRILSDFRMRSWDYVGLLAFLCIGVHRCLDGKVNHTWRCSSNCRMSASNTTVFRRCTGCRCKSRKGKASPCSAPMARGNPLCCESSTRCTFRRKVPSTSAASASRLNCSNQDGFALSFRRRVALVFQNPDVQLFNPTVFDEVAFGPLQLQWPKEQVLSRVAATLELMKIEHLRDRPPYRLSGGEKKRVALASVIVLDPEVLLLDEPTSTLDPRSQSQIIDLIQEWKGSSKTVITATHQLEIVEDIAERIVVLEEGKVAASGKPSEILSNHELLLRANLVHAHRHSHGTVTHSHPHLHSHSKHEHEH